MSVRTQCGHARIPVSRLLRKTSCLAPRLPMTRLSMIESTSSMDRPVAVGGLTRKRIAIAGAIALALIILAAVAYPSVRLWMRADRSVDASTLGIGTVTRGDLRRDVSVQARVVAALHPTLVSQAAGIVSLQAKAGQVVR